ncbi:MAG: BRO family protein [Acidiphilium sp.]|nr:BRO family protein [Acidiphilium sp.]MDD4936849.1 BRO family protein [Acidiphilium sp.]
MTTQNRKLEITKKEARTFAFGESKIRAFEEDGILWMAAKEVCKILGHSNVSVFLDMLEPDERRLEVMPTRNGPTKINFLSESGLYKAIFNSQVPKAVEFKRWVTRTVLPEIRKTGQFKGHTHREDPMEIEDIIRMMLVGREDGMYIATMINGTFEVNKWDKHVFLTGHQRLVFDMLTLFFTRAFLNYCDDGILKYVPKDSPVLPYLREFDWVLGCFLLPALHDLTENAVLPAREMVKEREARAAGALLAKPGEAPSVVRLKQSGFITDDGKGGYALNVARLEEYAGFSPTAFKRLNI